MAFKMRGNPMKRNFGVSPMKNYKDGYYKDEDVSGFKKGMAPYGYDAIDDTSYYDNQVEQEEKDWEKTKKEGDIAHDKLLKKEKRAELNNRIEGNSSKIKEKLSTLFDWIKDFKVR
jgi:hypothetical protein|tara:strand:- start:463 stop:810 length:348 start_codon:yes stop_codon:yes gene_type:complete